MEPDHATRSFRPVAWLRYLSPGLVAVLFALFVDIRFGASFLVCLAALPVFSIGLARLVAKRLRIQTTLSGSVVAKGGSVILTTQITSPVLFGFCELELNFLPSPRLPCPEPPAYSLSLGGRYAGRLRRTGKAAFWGVAELGVESARVWDVLHLVAFPVWLGDEATGRVAVLPDLPRIAESPLLRAAIEATAPEEDEDTPDSRLSFGGVPGYEHRGYQPGDSLRHINWKLSAKRDAYMVRLPEPVSKMTHTLLLDAAPPPSSGEEGLRGLKNEELLVETLLGLCDLLARQKMECTVRVWLDGIWRSDTVGDTRDVERLQYALAEYAYDDAAAGRLPAPAGGEGSVLLLSALPDEALLSALGAYEAAGCGVQLVLPPHTPAPPGAWRVDDHFTISRQ